MTYGNGPTPPINVRFEPSTLARIDAFAELLSSWRKSRSDAIRALVAKGLEAESDEREARGESRIDGKQTKAQRDAAFKASTAAMLEREGANKTAKKRTAAKSKRTKRGAR